MSKFTLSIIFLALSLTAQSSNELQTVSSVNIDSYMGKWYEYARYSNSFQRKCGGTTAEYKLIGHKVQVINTCERLDKEGKLQVAQGTALISDTATNSKLKVSFVPFFQRWGWFGGKYWIIELGDNYEYAVVGEPNRKFLWILSRTKNLPQETYDYLIDRLENVHHYDTSKLKISETFND